VSSTRWSPLGVSCDVYERCTSRAALTPAPLPILEEGEKQRVWSLRRAFAQLRDDQAVSGVEERQVRNEH
jgi:hypothetical protein